MPGHGVHVEASCQTLTVPDVLVDMRNADGIVFEEAALLCMVSAVILTLAGSAND